MRAVVRDVPFCAAVDSSEPNLSQITEQFNWVTWHDNPIECTPECTRERLINGYLNISSFMGRHSLIRPAKLEALA